MRSYRYFHLDVFTHHLFGGNQLAVFLDGRGLDAGTMQAIAKEMNFSESTFILPPQASGTDIRMRIFTPNEELPVAGHPTVGSTFALARAGIIEPGRKKFVFGLKIGPTPVSLAWRKNDLTFVWMNQRKPEFGEPVADDAGAAAAIGLSPAAIRRTRLPVQVVSCGVPFLYVPVATRRGVDSAALDRAAFAAFIRSSAVEAHGIFVFSPQPGDDKATVYSRMFAPDLGVSEDPATGIASGALGSYLVRHGVVTPGKARAMLSLQGVKMGRPSQVHISIGVKRREIGDVRVGGEAVFAGEGTLHI